jgi:hypothetical protein
VIAKRRKRAEPLLSRRRDSVPGEQEIVFTDRRVDARGLLVGRQAADDFCLALVSDTRALINRSTDEPRVRPLRGLFQLRFSILVHTLISESRLVARYNFSTGSSFRICIKCITNRREG